MVAMLLLFFLVMINIYLTNYCRIKENSMSLNGKIIFKVYQESINNFLDILYKKINIEYPKFFKMDNQSKLGVLASEGLTFENSFLSKYKPEEIGIVLSNSEASLDTDKNYINTLNPDNYFPSPSLFVYTLPNVVAGEICIRHKIKGENAFFISEWFNQDLIYFYIQNLLKNTETKVCIGGWINLVGENYDAFLFSVETNKKDGKSLTPELLNQIYNN